MRRRLLASLLFLAVAACEKPRPPPPLIVAPVPKPAPVEPPDAAVAELVAPTPEPEPEPGVPDDPPFDEGASEGVPLKKLLLRDPDLAAKSLEALATPDAWQVSLLAQLALKKGNPGPDLVPEAPMPEVLPETNRFSEPDGGLAFVATALLPLKASSKPKAATVMMLPINTELTVIAIDGDQASVTVEVATDVEFAATGSSPTKVKTVSKTGVVDARWLVTQPVESEALRALAATRKGSEQKEDEAVVLLHRAFLIDRTENARSKLLDVAWAAHRAAWVVTAAMAQLHVAPRRIETAYACSGDPTVARWLSFAKGKLPTKRPEAFCLAQVDLRDPCDEKGRAAWRERGTVLESAHLERAPLVQLVVDATRPRVLWFYSVPLLVHEACAITHEYKLDLGGVQVRRLLMPLGTAKTVVRVASKLYDGVELGVVGAPNEAKARGWLRKRSHYRWSIDSSASELAISLGIGDTDFENETDVTGVTWARPPAFDCASSCN